MVQALLRTWIVVLTCSALVTIYAPHSVAQPLSKGSGLQAMTIQQAVVSDGPQNMLGALKRFQEAACFLKTQHDCAKAGQMAIEARKEMANKVVALQNLADMLPEEITRSAGAGRKIMHGAKLSRNAMLLLMMKDEKALSRAEKITREGHGMLERGQKIVMTPRL